MTEATREGAIERILEFYDDESDGYYPALNKLVAIPTESQVPDRTSELEQYCVEAMTPAFERLGYECTVYENPFPGCGPVFLATRHEGDDLTTILGYGHGDVVRGQEGEWEQDRNPWELSFDGDRVYGRGTADNKGQHLAHVAALEAVIEARGSLGFNSKFVIEMGEENGSKGFRDVIVANREAFAADAYFASDGPRADMRKPNISLGNRGCRNFDLVVDLREGGHHSGNWGGLLQSPGAILCNALATITDPKGRILVDAWRPSGVPQSVLDAAALVERDAGKNAPDIDDDWGEPGLNHGQKVSAWNSFDVLAYEIGTPAKPVNAIPPRARATCQLRHAIETRSDDIVPALRAHLDERGFHQVVIEEPPASNRGMFEPGRTDPDHPWASWLKEAVDRSERGDCGVVPCSGGSNVTGIIQTELAMPFAWLPMSYMACSQHAPNEHVLKPLMREGMALITGVYWDLGDEERGYRP